MRRLFLVITRVLACGPLLSGPALAEDQSLLNRCWTPEALVGSDRERQSLHTHARLDLAPLRQEPLPAASPVPPELRGSIRGVTLPPGEKLIALTFDLCETDGDVAGYDGRIVDLLRAQGIRATFFAGGKWMETHKERAEQLIADPNFEVGSHGLRHYDLSRVGDPNLNDEIVLTQAAYAQTRANLLAKQCAAGFASENAVPERMSVMRFPYGRCSAKSLAGAADAGFIAIQWDLVTGAIIVAHANGRGWHTADALALAIPKLKEEGYSFVTVSELLAAGKPIIASKCYLNRPGDTPRLAKLQPKGVPHDIFSILGPDQ
jgi:peptidoglycan/xylan/chitin deacetylase (PgdA/CDA1 family)